MVARARPKLSVRDAATANTPTPAVPGAGPTATVLLGAAEQALPLYATPVVGPLLTPHLPRLLGARIAYRPAPLPLPPGCAGIVGWGLKGKALRAAALAERTGLPYVAVEDGFLRSVALGDVDPPLSVVVDDLGIYYDARRPSRLEAFIAAARTPAERARAAALAARWRAGRLSKYNHARETDPGDAPFVLVVDQTFGDASIRYGLADAQSFQRMLGAALDEHPQARIVLKVHPDVVAGRRRGHFEALDRASAARVTLLGSDAHPAALLERAEAVYTVTSQMGFEALLWGRPVRCFALPFYAGWGLTADDLPAPARRAARPGLEGLVHAALADYPRYLDPETLERCEPERVMDWMALQRRMRGRHVERIQAVAFSDWKKPIARAFLAGSRLDFVPAPSPLPQSEGAAVERACWGRPPDDSALARAADAPLLRVEDGFLRSVGLGANWVRPLSWVVDRRGMYYDAGQPSDLETLLQTAPFDDALRARAAALRRAIAAGGITKYNVGRGEWSRPAHAKRVVLVPGQVESDASITYGAAGGPRSNLELLRAVRAAEPDAYVLYKPHPDVLARKRRPGDSEAQAERHCDEVVTDVPIHRLFEAVDALHVLTSLAGFEALLRGRPVVCHGLPFYAGWGLTQDLRPHPRRTRRLALDELVAAALILYPIYVSRSSGAYTTPERALHELMHWDAEPPPRDAAWLRAARSLKAARDRWRRRR